MAETVFILCSGTSLACAVLLARSYRRTKTPLVMWSAICFFGLALNSILLFLDLVVFRDSIDLSVVRNIVGLVAVSSLLYGLIWEGP